MARGACTPRTPTPWRSCARSSTTTGRLASSACATWPRRPRTVNDRTKPRRRRQAVMAELVREIMIDATPETIWPFLTEPDKHLEWMGTAADIDPRPGGTYRVLVQGEHQSSGEFVEVVPLEKLVFTFGWEEDNHPIPPASTTIEITLHREGDKTRVQLVHRGLPDGAVDDHSNGWDHYLSRLAVATTGGDAGADERTS